MKRSVAGDVRRPLKNLAADAEPNPFATLWAPFNVDSRYDYQRPCVERLYATLCAYWLERSNLLPGAVAELRAFSGPSPE